MEGEEGSSGYIQFTIRFLYGDNGKRNEVLNLYE